VERPLVCVFSCSYGLVVPTAAISLFAVRARESNASLSRSWNYGFNESFRPDVLSGIHVYGHLVQGAPMAHRCVDRHFWSPASGQYCTVLAMVLGGLNTHFFRIGKLSAPRPIRLAQEADDLFILWRRDPHRLDLPANIT